jgi:hypothetical protein
VGKGSRASGGGLTCLFSRRVKHSFSVLVAGNIHLLPPPQDLPSTLVRQRNYFPDVILHRRESERARIPTPAARPDSPPPSRRHALNNKVIYKFRLRVVAGYVASVTELWQLPSLHYSFHPPFARPPAPAIHPSSSLGWSRLGSGNRSGYRSTGRSPFSSPRDSRRERDVER